MEFWAINHVLNGYFSPKKVNVRLPWTKKKLSPPTGCAPWGSSGGVILVTYSKKKKFRTSQSSMTKSVPNDLKRALNTKLRQWFFFFFFEKIWIFNFLVTYSLLDIQFYIRINGILGYKSYVKWLFFTKQVSFRLPWTKKKLSPPAGCAPWGTSGGSFWNLKFWNFFFFFLNFLSLFE